MSRDWNTLHGRSNFSTRVTPRANTRACHGSAKTSSPLSRGGAPSPSKTTSEDTLHADHRVARYERRKVFFAESVRARRTLGQDEVTDLGARIPHAHLDVIRQRRAHLGEQGARFAHGP